MKINIINIQAAAYHAETFGQCKARIYVHLEDRADKLLFGQVAQIEKLVHKTFQNRETKVHIGSLLQIVIGTKKVTKDWSDVIDISQEFLDKLRQIIEEGTAI